MRLGLSQDQQQVPARSAPDVMPPPTAAPTTKEIPYDYVAKFKLQGKPGNRVQDVINISIEGAFVAVAIGYSFIPAKLPVLPPPGSILLTSPPPTGEGVGWLLANAILPVVEDPRMLAQCLLVRLCGIDFKYSIIDSGSGRELQNQPIHNIAGLGEATGDRPFRPLAKPMLFMPRSTIRVEVEEISEGPIYGYEDSVTKQRVGAELFIVLHGYKILGYGTALS
ncbi:MAG: hypothetical protein AABZ34_04295 [Nitrospirota bacterium]